MSKRFEDLRKMSYEELIKQHDDLATGTQVGVAYYLEEINRKDQERQTIVMLKYTRWITIMTIIMTVATIINVYLSYH